MLESTVPAAYSPETVTVLSLSPVGSVTGTSSSPATTQWPHSLFDLPASEVLTTCTPDILLPHPQSQHLPIRPLLTLAILLVQSTEHKGKIAATTHSLF